LSFSVLVLPRNVTVLVPQTIFDQAMAASGYGQGGRAGQMFQFLFLLSGQERDHPHAARDVTRQGWTPQGLRSTGPIRFPKRVASLLHGEPKQD
jgi:hypothetical protein